MIAEGWNGKLLTLLARPSGDLAIHVHDEHGTLVAFSDGLDAAFEVFVSSIAADGDATITDPDEMGALCGEVCGWVVDGSGRPGMEGQVALAGGRRVVVRLGEVLPAAELADVAPWLTGRDCLPASWLPLDGDELGDDPF